MSTKIKMLRDFKGHASQDQLFKSGEVVAVDDWQVELLVADGAAEVVENDPENKHVKHAAKKAAK